MASWEWKKNVDEIKIQRATKGKIEDDKVAIN